MSSGATDKIDFTQSSIDSLSSYDETDYICEQLSHCASFGVNGFLVSFAQRYQQQKTIFSLSQVSVF